MDIHEHKTMHFMNRVNNRFTIEFTRWRWCNLCRVNRRSSWPKHNRKSNGITGYAERKHEPMNGWRRFQPVIPPVPVHQFSTDILFFCVVMDWFTVWFSWAFKATLPGLALGRVHHYITAVASCRHVCRKAALGGFCRPRPVLSSIVSLFFAFIFVGRQSMGR